MTFVLEIFTLTVVIGFLYAMLERSMTQEHLNQYNAQKAELQLSLTNRISQFESRIKEISLNNHIKVSLMLGMSSRIVEIMETLYSPGYGNTYFIRNRSGIFIPVEKSLPAILQNKIIWPQQPDVVIRRPMEASVLVIVKPIYQQDRLQGHVTGIFNLSDDPYFSELLDSFSGLHLVYPGTDHMIDVFSGDPLFEIPSQDQPLSYQNATLLDRFRQQPYLQPLNLEEFPSLYFWMDPQLLIKKKRKLIKDLVLICVPLFFLTTAVSFAILRKMTSSLDSLARNAQHIATSDNHAALDESRVRHVEFLYLTRAFNQVLAKVRQQSEAYQDANQNLQKQIRERQEVEEALRLSETQMRSLWSNIPIGLYRRTLDGLLLSANPKFVSIFGYDNEEEMLQVSVPQLYCEPEDYQNLLMNLETLDTIQACESQFRCKNGSIIWCTFDIKKVKDPKTGKFFINGAVQDITYRKQIEAEKQNLEIQLRQAQKMEAIGTLAGGIAHDFNNILSAIIGFCELAYDDAEADSLQQDNIKEALVAARRASDLVKQILTFARQTEVEKRPVQVDGILKETLKLLRATIPTTIEIKTITESRRMICIDPTQLHQIIVNLCANAAHAMREKGGILSVELSDMDILPGNNKIKMDLSPGQYVRLTVSDTGHGMPREIIDRIFDPYFTTKQQGEGTGMGLSVVQGIVSSMGGIIHVTSTQQKGSKFSILLPSIEKQAIRVETGGEQMVGGSEHILFVDDEIAITQMGRQTLERIGYRVTVRTNALEALELFRNAPHRFDLIISDVTMPHMAGKQFAEEVFRIRPDMPLIMCTGYSDQISKETAAAIGVKALLYKPLIRNDLAVTLRGVLDGRLPPQNFN